MVDRQFVKQLEGMSLTTAEIIYYLPDYRHILQTFIWQEYDVAPKFPRLVSFLHYWERHIEGPLHSVRVAHAGLITPAEIRLVKHQLSLH
jgi:uncharacterized protein Usg